MRFGSRLPSRPDRHVRSSNFCMDKHTLCLNSLNVDFAHLVHCKIFPLTV